MSQFVDLRGQDEVALRQAVDLMGPGLDLDLAPCQIEIWMVALRFRYRSHAVYELQRRAEIGKRERFREMVLADYLPAGHLALQRFQLFALQGRHSSPAGYAMFLCQTHYRSPMREWKSSTLYNIPGCRLRNCVPGGSDSRRTPPRSWSASRDGVGRNALAQPNGLDCPRRP